MIKITRTDKDGTWELKFDKLGIPFWIILYYVFYVFQLPAWPIIAKLQGHGWTAAVERASLNYIPWWLTYSFNIATFVLAPYSAYLLIKQRRILWGFLFYSGVSAAMLVSGAKSFIVFFTVHFYWVLWREKRINLLPMWTLLSVFLLFLIFSPYSPRTYLDQRTAPPTTMTERARSMNNAACADSDQLTCICSYVTYRLIFVPWEVRSKWYEFFSVHPKVGLFPNDHPANLVGYNEFYLKHPESFTPLAKAYASFDADAFGRFGYTGVLVSCLLVIAFGGLLFLLRVDPTLWGMPWIHMALSLPQASVQAWLGAQGALLWILILWWHRRETK